ncbi:hypothetical protein [Salinicoccus halitifaciens]|uniref:Holin n=1 Tax=Salinicoccus halitifaciens TaxID=1073415 RepID=A0ABV2E5U2_9STAP|nr:hypothetical protein [Salinicoccus halitifaciens]MCD2137162.1 hypothetical protein [Salinicoccus halitifaciens]
MIKKFIDKVESLSTHAWIAILSYIDETLDDHNDRLDTLEEKLEKFESDFEPTKAEVENKAETRKLIKKTGLTVVVTTVVTFILRHFGIV